MRIAAGRVGQVLADLIAATPGDEGKWFAAAKSAGLFDEAARLAQRSPCDPRTLIRAARDFAGKRPDFAVEAGLAALHWIARGYGYEITGADVREAYSHIIEAAETAGTVELTRGRVRRQVEQAPTNRDFMIRALGHDLGTS